MNNKRKFLKTWIILVVLVLIVTFIQLPYYVTSPGMAKTLAPIIKVEGGYGGEQGNFMLTTIRVARANILGYTWAKMSDYKVIYDESQMRPHGQTNEQYYQLQLKMMNDSQEAATYVAYKQAGKKVEIKNKGVYIAGVVPGMPAADKLKVGDLILAVNKAEVKDAETLINLVSGKKAGESVTLNIQRNERQEKFTLPLQPFPQNKAKVGLGIQLQTEREVIASPPVQIDTSKIGGPSAGLMFSLEIYNQLVEQDITKGYQIAGTGTINDQGSVGPIGGIDQKIVAANQAGAEIFFAPSENYQAAVKTGKDIGAHMKIVRVEHFGDALNYLETLPSKQ